MVTLGTMTKLCALGMQQIDAEPGYIVLEAAIREVDATGATVAVLVPPSRFTIPSSEIAAGRASIADAVATLTGALATNHAAHAQALDAVRTLGIPKKQAAVKAPATDPTPVP